MRRITRSRKSAAKRSQEAAFVVPDPHCPFHCEAKTQHLLDDIKATKPTHIVLLGDVIDAYSASSFDKNPSRRALIGEECRVGHDWLAAIRKAAGWAATIVMCEGNHEDRIRRLLWSKAPGLADLHALTIPALLKLDELNISYKGRAGFKLWDRRFKHGDLVTSKAGYTARREMEQHRCSGFSAHTHRLGAATFTDKEGVTTSWWEAGHMCDMGFVDYTSSPDWQGGYLRLFDMSTDLRVEPVYLD